MKKALWLTGCLMFLTACNNTTPEEIEKAKVSNEIINQRQTFLPNVGDQMNIEFVKHIEKNEYELGYVKNGYLVWVNIFDIGKGGVIVRYDDTLEKSTLRREENRIEEDPVLGVYIYDVYTLTVSNGLQGGTIERSCGKNCIDTLQTNILNGN